MKLLACVLFHTGLSCAIKSAGEGAPREACGFGLLSITVELVSSDSCFGGAAHHSDLTSPLLSHLAPVS